MTFAAYIPVVPQSPSPSTPPVVVDDFNPTVIGALLIALLGLIVLSRR